MIANVLDVSSPFVAPFAGAVEGFGSAGAGAGGAGLRERRVDGRPEELSWMICGVCVRDERKTLGEGRTYLDDAVDPAPGCDDLAPVFVFTPRYAPPSVRLCALSAPPSPSADLD